MSNQMRLIDLTDETTAEWRERIEHKLDSMNRKIDALLAAKADDQPTLLAMVAACPASVVPNEDEAMPVVATCPPCAKTATADTVVDLFGYRPTEKRPLRVQSWCRECRALEAATSPRKRAKATLWSKMDAQACAFAKAYTQARNEMMQYKVKLDNESLTPSVRANLLAKYETKRAEQAKHKSEYNKRVAVLQASLTN